jgi:hypothetical protein
MGMDKHFALSLFHLLIIVPFFLYVGVYRAATHPWVYKALMALGAILLLFHGSKLAARLAVRSDYAYINAIHVLFAPLLIYIGWHQQDTPRAAYEMLLMITFAAFGYHLFSLVRILQIQE